MSVVPHRQVDRIEFYENRIAQWTTNASAMGSSTPEVTAMAAKITAARNALTAAQQARIASKDATLALHEAVRAMDIAGQAIIKQVRAKAESTGDPGVYALASIPAPAVPSPVGPPGKPYAFVVRLLQEGQLEMGWKCNNPAGCTGVMYHVFRKPTGGGEYTFLGASGERRFIDATIPAGVNAVTYKIQAKRSTSEGEAVEFNVNFGAAGGGMTASVVETPKLAA